MTKELEREYCINPKYRPGTWQEYKRFVESVEKSIKEKAINEFEDAITQLGLDYGISDEVMESYCDKFKCNI